MLPAKPPLPTPCSRRFHLATGSHTSILISESALGVAVICTRQKAGSDLKIGSGPSPSKWGRGGGVKAPAGITWAEVTPAAGSDASASFFAGTGRRLSRLRRSGGTEEQSCSRGEKQFVHGASGVRNRAIGSSPDPLQW